MPLSEYMALAERNQPSSVDPEAVQSQFWRRVVTGEQGVMYGSDTDAASLFVGGFGRSYGPACRWAASRRLR